MNENKSFPEIENEHTLKQISLLFNDIKKQCNKNEFKTIFTINDRELMRNAQEITFEDKLSPEESKMLYEYSEKIQTNVQSFGDQKKRKFIHLKCESIQKTLKKGELVNIQPNQINGFNC